MESGIFQIELLDGRIFRVYYKNRSQKERIIKAYNSIADKCLSFNQLTSGLHNATQFETIIKDL